MSLRAKWLKITKGRRIGLLLASFALILIIGWIATPLPRPLFPEDYSTVVTAANGRPLSIFLNGAEQWCLPPDDRPLPDKLAQAVILYEDRRFYLHPGVDPIAIVRATIRAILRRGKLSGASTISMQVARLASPKPRTILAKIIEAYHALKIETRYSKTEILRLYLCHAPYGGNILGYRAASLKYYGIEPSQLTWAEAAMFAVLPNDPALANPFRNRDLLRKKRDALLKKMFRRGIIDEETLELSLLEELPETRLPFDSHAPHLCRRIANTRHGTEVETTIDFELQARLERLAKEHSKMLGDYGIKNLAILVAETKTGYVRAYIGSQDFGDSLCSGQVDGVTAPRSTGSILKPFLYALAIDEAQILPQSQLKDIPTFYGAFSPMNSDKAYRGIVSAKSALVKSLNVPAVRLLYSYGIDEFYDFLKSAGMTTLFRSPREYGLPLIIGGAEGRLWEITAMFAGLGNLGDFRGISVFEGERPEKRLIGRGASYLTLEMLRELDRPGAEFYWHQFENRRPIAWKTGTSYGNRDGWAVGVSPEWTIGIWAGNFDGASNPNLSGASCAGTLLFTVFNSLPRSDEGWFAAPMDDLEKVTLCPESGFPAGPYCEGTIEALAPRWQNRNLEICPYHRKIFLDESGRFQVCSRCWEGIKYREESRIVYPPEVVQFLAERGQAFQALPPHNSKCPVFEGSRSVNVVYPKDGSSLYIPRGVGGAYEKVILRAAVSTAEAELYWYLDERFIGATAMEHNLPIELPAGDHRLTVLDPEGRSATVRFKAMKN